MAVTTKRMMSTPFESITFLIRCFCPYFIVSFCCLHHPCKMTWFPRFRRLHVSEVVAKMQPLKFPVFSRMWSVCLTKTRELYLWLISNDVYLEDHMIHRLIVWYMCLLVPVLTVMLAQFFSFFARDELARILSSSKLFKMGLLPWTSCYETHLVLITYGTL